MILKHQKGTTLLEALIALAILSFAILGLMALQTSLLRQTGQSKSRVQATLLAQNLMGLISVNKDQASCYLTTGASCSSTDASTQMTTWKNEVLAALPNATSTEVLAAMPSSQNPSVVLGSDNSITITLGWKDKSDSAVRNLIIVGRPW